MVKIKVKKYFLSQNNDVVNLEAARNPTRVILMAERYLNTASQFLYRKMFAHIACVNPYLGMLCLDHLE